MSVEVEGSERYRREQEFHDQRFDHDGGVRGASRFYSVNRACNAHYDEVLARVPSGARVLEYGCGVGGAAFALAAKGISVTAIDISPVAVEAARQAAAEAGLVSARFEVMNAEHLEAEDESFDVVCGSGILHHLELEPACAEVARVLSPRGWAIFLEPLGHNPLINLYRRVTPGMRTEDEHPLLVSDWTTFERHFGIVRSASYALTTLAAIPFSTSAHVDRIVAPLERADRALTDRVPWLSRYAWTTVIELAQPRR